MTEGELLERLAEGRLRAHARWAGAALVLSCAFPHGLLEGRAFFLWQIAPDLAPARVAAALALPITGLALLAWSWARVSPRALSQGVAALLAGLAPTAWVSSPFDTDEAAFGFLHRSMPFALSVGLAVASVDSLAGGASRGRARALGWAAAAVCAAQYAFPFADESPLSSLRRLVGLVAHSPSPQVVSAALLVTPVALFPALAVGLSLWLTRPGQKPSAPLSLLLALLGLPSLLVGWAFRALEGQRGGGGELLSGAGEALSLFALLSLSAHAFSLLARSPGPRDDASWKHRIRTSPALAGLASRAGLAGLACLLAFSPALAGWVGSRGGPPAMSSGATAPRQVVDQEKLDEARGWFAVSLPRWNDARRRTDLHGAPPPVAIERELVEKARGLDAGLGREVERLVSEAGSRSLTLRRWGRLTARVNEQARRAGLPFRVDPTEGVAEAGEGARRWFRLDTFSIERARRVEAGRQAAEVLGLRALTPGRGVLQVLGLSRDGEAAALVLLDTVDDQAGELARLSRKSPPRCSEERPEGAALGEAQARCGEILASLEAEGATAAALLSSVERHEIEHQLDGPRLALARVVRERMPLHEPRESAEASRELSAYLAELTARGAGSSRLSLARLYRFASSRRASLERQVGRMALEALSGREASTAEGAAGAFVALAALSPEALAGQARAAWREQFGSPLPEPLPEPLAADQRNSQR